MKRFILPLLVTLPLAGCFDSEDKDVQKLVRLDEAVKPNYTITEGEVFSVKIPKVRGKLILAQSEIKDVAINAVSDGWVLSFKSPWVSIDTGGFMNSVPYSLVLTQRVDEFKSIKKTIQFNVMDIKSVPTIDFSFTSVQPPSVSVAFKEKVKKKNIINVRTRNEHGFVLPFKVVEKDADNISLAVTVSQNQSALSGAKIEQVGDNDFKLVVPIDVSNKLKDVEVTLSVSDSDGESMYTVDHLRLITPQINLKISEAIHVSPSKVVAINFDKNFAGFDYQIEHKFYEKDMSPLNSNVWVDVKPFTDGDFIELSTSAVPERWEGIIEITVIREGERGVHHYPIRVSK